MEGQRIAGRFRLDSVIASDDSGVVWQATDVLLGQPVVVKEIRHSPGVPARDVSALHHPNIATIRGVVEQDGRWWIVMAPVEGESLAQRVQGGGPMPAPEVARIAAAVLAALEAAHAAGIAHGDLTPSNVLIRSDGQVKVTGFAEPVPVVVEDPEAAPARSGEAADLVALGALMLFALEGQPIAPGQRLQHPGRLNAVIDGLLDPDPTGRLAAANARTALASPASFEPIGRPLPPPSGAELPPLLEEHAAAAPGRGTPAGPPPPSPAPVEPDPDDPFILLRAGGVPDGEPEAAPEGRRRRRAVLLSGVAVFLVIAVVATLVGFHVFSPAASPSTHPTTSLPTTDISGPPSTDPVPTLTVTPTSPDPVISSASPDVVTSSTPDQPAAPRVTSLSVSPSISSQTTSCTYATKIKISVSAATKVSYNYQRDNTGKSSTSTVTFSGSGTKEISLATSSKHSAGSAYVQVNVSSPNSLTKRTDFTVPSQCTAAGYASPSIQVLGNGYDHYHYYCTGQAINIAITMDFDPSITPMIVSYNIGWSEGSDSDTIESKTFLATDITRRYASDTIYADGPGTVRYTVQTTSPCSCYDYFDFVITCM